MNKNILLTIVPIGYWVTFITGILFLLIGGKYVAMSYVTFNILLFPLSAKLAILIHEVGHLVFAKLARGNPRRLILGNGHKVSKINLGNFIIILNSNFNSGAAYATFPTESLLRIKLILFTSGGIIFNLITAMALISISDFSTKFAVEIQLFSVLAIANLLSAVLASVPYYTRHLGTKLSSDGLSLLKIPFHKKSELYKIIFMNDLLDGCEKYESREYESARTILTNILKKDKNIESAKYNLSLVFMKLGNYDKALELLKDLLLLKDQKQFKDFTHYIYNSIAWLYLINNNLTEADYYSELAYQESSRSKFNRGTRGAVLIANGEIEKGKNLLLDNIDFNFPNTITINAAMNLSLAYYILGENKKSDKHLEFVQENIELLDNEELILLERVKNKMAQKNNNRVV